MEYIKLIALNIDDFCSSIIFEDNYALADIEKVNKDKQDLEEKGYVCLIVKTTSNVRI